MCDKNTHVTKNKWQNDIRMTTPFYGESFSQITVTYATERR